MVMMAKVIEMMNDHGHDDDVGGGAHIQEAGKAQYKTF